MIVPASQFPHVYDAMRQDKHTSEDKGVVIFVANGDVDSVCAAYQMESLLTKSDMVTCIHPVENYEALVHACAEDKSLSDAQELKTAVFINCGATEDLRSRLKLPDSVRLIIIDAHRPIWHGYNNMDDQSVLVLLDDDDPVPRSAIPEYREDEGHSEDEDDEEPDDMEDVYSMDDPAGAAGGGPGSEREGHAGSETQEDGPSGSGRAQRRGRQDGDGVGRPPKRSRTQQDEERRKRRQAVAEYYESNAGYGKPAALLVLGLAHALTQDNNFHIWLAILGITDQYIHQRMDPMRYIRWRGEMEAHVVTHNGQLAYTDQDALAGGAQNNLAHHAVTVRRVEDLKIPLLKRWTLSEAMQCTTHIATRLQSWKEAGKKNVELMLAAMNIQKPQRTAPFSSMRPEVYPHLLNKFKTMAAKFGLVYEALKYDGFEVQYKNDFRMLATDYALALTAVLGQPRGEALTAEDAFLKATDCLMPHKSHGIEALKAGIERAKHLAAIVVDQGGQLLSQHAVRGARDPFWYVDLSSRTIQHSGDFHHHSALVKLAIFIRDAQAIRTRSMKPIVLVGPPNSEGQCYVVALRDKVVTGSLQNNPFSVPLQEALNDTVGNAEDVRVTFDSTVLLLKQSVVHQVLAELKMKIKAYQAPLAT